MTDITFATGLVAHIPLLFTDANGVSAAAPSNGAITVDNLAVATAVLSSPSAIDVTGLTVGVTTLTYTAGAITGTLVITLTAAGTGTGGVATAVAFDTVNTTFTPAV